MNDDYTKSLEQRIAELEEINERQRKEIDDIKEKANEAESANSKLDEVYDFVARKLKDDELYDDDSETDQRHPYAKTLRKIKEIINGADK